ncbi:hypothetical protein [Nocardia wallacei]|uniref:hypothetical protein n=1 Tax=Nocardia TaxID=1817 RepID=UPI002455F170|nr:hypothetical protein [Nocardia wallacei]
MRALFAVLSMATTAAWLVGYLAPIWQPDYKPPPELNIVMMAIIGIFATLYSKARKAGSSESDSKEEGKRDDE